MNIRSLIKLIKCEIATVSTEQRNYDNPYEFKLNIWHGSSEAPYHEYVAFTKQELLELKDNLHLLCDELNKCQIK